VRDPRGGTLVPVEVRQWHARRCGRQHHGRESAVHRLRGAAPHRSLRVPPPCRFDVVRVEERIEWIQRAFDAG
jgi:putative endonuclease